MSAGIRNRLESIVIYKHVALDGGKSLWVKLDDFNKVDSSLQIAVAALEECSKAAKTMGDIEDVYFRNQERAKKAIAEITDILK